MGDRLDEVEDDVLAADRDDAFRPSPENRWIVNDGVVRTALARKRLTIEELLPPSEV